MINRMTALLALVTFVLFVAVVPFFVPETDLILLAIGTFLLAGYDFWRELFSKREQK